MLDEYTHLKYHQYRQRELVRRANLERLLAQRREKRQGKLRITVLAFFRGLMKAHLATRNPRRKAWAEEMNTLNEPNPRRRIA